MNYLRASMICVTMLAASGIVQAAPFGYSVDDAFPDTLYKIDFGTGATTPIGAVLNLGPGTSFLHTDVEALAMSTSGVLYAIDAEFNMLITIDPLTGMATTVMTGLDVEDVGLAPTTTGKLIMSDELDSGDTKFFEIDPGAATVTELFTTTAPSIDGLAYLGGDIYGISATTDQLYLVDATAGGTVTPIGSGLGVDLDDEVGLASDGIGLYAVDDGFEGEDFGLAIKIDPLSGEASVLFPYVHQFEGLAMARVADVPEPAALASLLALTGFGLFARFRRRNRNS